MKVHLGVALAALVTGCGDNSKECGPGTTSDDGICTPTATCGAGTKDDGTGTCVPDGTMVCASGTIFDATSGTCQIDPTACQDGTVPIDGACVDPNRGLMVDVEEGAEPNGFGMLGEASTSPAGLITLKATGATVIHGTIIPADHDGDGRLDPDVDTYVFTAASPMLLHVGVTGLHGLAGGFDLIASNPMDPQLAAWQRFGVNLTGAVSARDIFIPAAGTYFLAITDARTLALDGNPPVGADPNNPAFEYYASITPQPMPTPKALTVAANTVVVDDILDPGAIRFFTVALGTGLNDVVLEAPAGAVSATDAIKASVVVLDNGVFRGVGTEHLVSGAPVPAEAIVGGFAAGDTALVVADTESDWALEATPFHLAITTAGATPLAANGTASAPFVTSHPTAPTTDLAWFYFDVVAAGDTDGLALSFEVPVDAVLVDQNFDIVAPFTWLSGAPSGNTMTSYVGLVRFPTPGRYYLGVYAPGGAPGDPIVVTSQYRRSPPITALPDGGISFSPEASYGAFAFEFAPGADVWESFDGGSDASDSGTGTGPITVDYYAAGSAFGRLDPLDVATPTAVTLPPDPIPIFENVFPEDGATFGRILLDDATPRYLLHVRPATLATVYVDFGKQLYTDFGTVAPGATATRTRPIAMGTTDRYLVRTPPGSHLTITLHAETSAASFSLALLDASETAVQTLVAGPGDAIATTEATHGWTALAIRSTALDAQTYDLTVAVATP